MEGVRRLKKVKKVKDKEQIRKEKKIGGIRKV